MVYYENDGKYPPAPILVAMAGAFSVTIETLMSPDEPKSKTTTPDGPNLLNADDRRLWKRLQQLKTIPERDQRAILRMLDAMATKAG